MGNAKKLRSEMTEAERVADRRRCKAAKYRREVLGLPDLTSAEETERAIRKVKSSCYRHGMSTVQLAEAAYVSTTTIKDILTGSRTPDRPLKHLYRETYDAIMAMEIRPPDGRARVPVVGAQRRLQALTAAGFTLKTLAEFMGYQNYQRVYQLQHRPGKIYWDTYRLVVEVYDKHHDENPSDYGITSASQKYALSAAKRNGWAPPWCWDEDTIDDPDAFPEWTGACGTAEGYRIHIRETFFGDGDPLPPCDPCKAAVEKKPPNLPRKYPLRLDVLREAMGKLKYGETGPLADRVIPESKNAIDTLCRYKDGSRSPRKRAVVDRLCYELGLTFEELVDLDALAHESQAAVAIGEGYFNPYILRVAMDLAGISQHKLSMVPGFEMSAGAIGKWVAGEMSPRYPSKLDPIAKYFGVKTEVFYS